MDFVLMCSTCSTTQTGSRRDNAPQLLLQPLAQLLLLQTKTFVPVNPPL